MELIFSKTIIRNCNHRSQQVKIFSPTIFSTALNMIELKKLICILKHHLEAGVVHRITFVYTSGGQKVLTSETLRRQIIIWCHHIYDHIVMHMITYIIICIAL